MPSISLACFACHTGGTSPIAQELCLALVAKGAHVVLGCRSVEAGEKVAREVKEQVAKEAVEKVAKGAQVVPGCRSVEAGEKLTAGEALVLEHPGAKVTVMHCELSSLSKACLFAEELKVCV